MARDKLIIAPTKLLRSPHLKRRSFVKLQINAAKTVVLGLHQLGMASRKERLQVSCFVHQVESAPPDLKESGSRSQHLLSPTSARASLLIYVLSLHLSLDKWTWFIFGFGGVNPFPGLDPGDAVHSPY